MSYSCSMMLDQAGRTFVGFGIGNSNFVLRI